MCAALIRRVDPWQLARQGERVVGVLSAERLGRLRAVAVPLGAFDVRLRFDEVDGPGAPAAVLVSMQVSGRVRTVCQRCLEPLELPVEIDGAVMVALSDAVAVAAGGDTEALVLGPEEMLELDDLVQDEVMLALPFAPRHDPGDCMSHDHQIDDSMDGASAHDGQTRAGSGPHERELVESNEIRTNNPFAVLASLKSDDRDEN